MLGGNIAIVNVGKKGTKMTKENKNKYGYEIVKTSLGCAGKYKDKWVYGTSEYDVKNKLKEIIKQDWKDKLEFERDWGC